MLMAQSWRMCRNTNGIRDWPCWRPLVIGGTFYFINFPFIDSEWIYIIFMCFSDKFIHSLIQFKDLSKFTNFPHLILHVVQFSTRSNFHISLQIFVGCTSPTKLWSSFKSLKYISFISVFPTPSPVHGIYSRHAKYTEMNEFSLDHQ